VEREHRISAGAIVINDNKILLVRYKDKYGYNYLVCPGGGVEGINEGVNGTAIREVREETGLEVNPQKIIFVEDILWRRYRIVKIWFLCDLISGKLVRTQGAIEEGITEAGWYRKDQLHSEVVYPPTILSYDWDIFFKDNWEAKYLGLSKAKF
jgi:8-oxo-dGTP diphosphatase